MMKKLYNSLAGGIVLAAIVTSCAQELVNPEVDITSVRCSISQIDTEEDFATGIVDTLPATKATFSNNSFLWSVGDRIGIVPNSGSQIYFAVDDGAGTSTASFDGGDWAMKSTGTFYAYYPLYPDIFLSKDHVSVSYTGQAQTGNNNNLHTGDFWTLYTEGTTAVGNTLNFSFNHLTSFFKTYVTVPAGTYTKITFSAPSAVFVKDGYFDLSAQTPAIVGTTFTNELTLDLQGVTFAAETELTGYLVVAPVDITGIPITVTVFKDGTATYEYTLTKASPMVPAKTYAFRATALTQLVSSVAQANTLFASGATAVTVTEPLTEDSTVVLPDTDEAVTLTLPTTASSSKLTVSYGPSASSYPATLAITGPEGADLEIQTPNSTVTVNGIAYDQITSRTAANTCIIPAGVTVSVLKVLQGGVQVFGTVSQIDLSEQEDDAIISVSGTVASLLGEDDEEYTPATGVSLNQPSITLAVGETETLTATVAPVGAYPFIIWTSSDEAVATVSSTGVVTAVATGSTTITATTISGGFMANCSLTVAPSIINDPFTITSTGNTTVSFRKKGSPGDITLEYRKGNDDWASYSIGTGIALADGESSQFRAGEGGNDTFNSGYSDYYQVSIGGAGTVEASGNIMSLLNRYLIRNEVPAYCFARLFNNCEKLVDVDNLKFPATTLAEGCYNGMFEWCTGLTSGPELPATTLASRCYEKLFSCCTGLTSAPQLPATTLADRCYSEMFYGCALTSAPELPATTLAEGCYWSMFKGCEGLTSAPELPATIMAPMCYLDMFMWCTGLTSAPELPATTLAGSCYQLMFENCTGLISAPELPATTLAGGCYKGMFSGCTGLISAPVLPATTLSTYCYNEMFKGCTSLTTAPELPATTLVQGCYGYMFEGCCNLSYIKMLATDISASWCLSNWVSGVSDTGNFVKSSSATWDETGVSGIPSEWTVFTPNSGILLNKAAISLNVGATEKLTASVAPFVANPEIIWTSSDENVATVSSTGMVTAIAVGASTITAKSGGFTATCAISVKIIPAGAVDLGLSVFWASSNLSESGFVGSPEEYGDYYAWGETSTYYSSQDPLTWKNGKTGYDWESYSLYDSNNYSLTKYNNNSNYGIVDNKTVLDPEDDVAHVKLGGSWRMPTDAEWTELRENCTWTWTTQNGVKGRLVTSNTNGNSIFLPAAGSRSNASLFNAGSLGLYRSSSLVTNSLYYAWSVSLDYATVERGNTLRCNGLSVRPVAE